MLLFTSMFFRHLAARRKKRVLRVVSEGVLSVKEIALRSRLSEFRAGEALRDLESKNFLVSGNLMPVGLRVYRLTSEGERALAGGVSI